MTESQPPRPSLRSAQQRVVDAAIRINDLHQLLADMDAHARANPMRITFPAEQRFADPATIEPRVEWGGAHSTERLQDARRLTSEAIHHLRTSLDYLAFQLVWLDGGQPFMNSAFPMCKKSREWESTVQRRVPSLTQQHQRALKRLQPFKHCRWISRLQELSNQDKHRYVLAMNTFMGGKFTWKPEDAYPDPNDPTRYRIDMQQDAPLQIELSGGGDAVATLEWIANECADLLNSLPADFGETNRLTLSRGSS